MIPTVWEIIVLSISIVITLILLTTTILRWVWTKPVVWHFMGVYPYIYVVLICIINISDIIWKIAWGSIPGMFFTVATISVLVICGINEGFNCRVEDLGAVDAKLHAMQTVLCRLEEIKFAERCNVWLKRVGNLQCTKNDIKARYDGCGHNYLKKFTLVPKVEQIFNVAYGLLREGEDLLHPQDQLWGTTNFYKKLVIGFIEDMADDSGMLGIWGMGGVGKTSVLKLLIGHSRSEYDNNDSFKVLFVRAGIGCTVGQVQERIATSMGLSQERNETSQAKIIHGHLKDKSFLLLLDDLWGYLDLKAVGIPSPLGTVRAHPRQKRRRRKVVLTSRYMELCDTMGCRRGNTIQMDRFNEEDAWDLYYNGWPNKTIGSFMDRPPEVLVAQKLSRSIHTVGVGVGVGDVQPQHPKYDPLLLGMMGAYEKVCYFIEDMGAQSILLGVWGMRGVGKTALLRLVRDSYTGNSSFDHVIFLGAGTGSIVKDVQHAIAINLGLDMAMMSSLDELSRAMHISNYLEHKSFLLLLDDIREPLNWWAIGMPMLSSRLHMIILATRSQAACALMGCHQIIEIQCLGVDAAWNLFTDKAGLRFVDDQVRHFAKQMVTRCGGLPLALCSLGRAMSNKRDPREWRSACSQLTAMRLEPCEIDERVGTIILNTPYGWRKDNTPS